jgi:phenylalanyl-tRNA synthetase beta chain
MKVPLSWLKEYLDLDLSPKEIADLLTLGGLEVEKIEFPEMREGADPIFEISLTPNLGHCMSILGIARELSALLDIKLKKHSSEIQENDPSSIHQMLHVDIQDKAQCARYACRIVKNVQIGPSPDWLGRRLESCGIRSLNTLVDVGNYVMLEMGQPLHIFDYDAIEGQKIAISSNTPYASLTTLDEKNRQIPKEVLLICDAKKPLAFAGVMGGMGSSVAEKTRNVLIESALFTPEAIRKSSKLLNLRSESSGRFEKGIDPEGILKALDRAAALLQEISGGTIVQGIIDSGMRQSHPKYIRLRIARVNQLLGTALSMNEIVSLLHRLEIKIRAEEKEFFDAIIPSYRNDLHTEIDLIEEIGRIYGYNNIPQQAPRHISSSLSDAPIFEFENEIKMRCVNEGLQEFLTCDLISPTLAEIALERGESEKILIHVLHPSSIDQSVLRPTLLPGLLQAIKFNIDHQNPDINAFEVGRIHFKEGQHCKEQSMAAIVMTGKRTPYHWDPKPREIDFFDLKGIIENLCESLKTPTLNFEASHLPQFHPSRQARIKTGNILCGVIGEIHPAHINAFDIGQRVLFAELNLHDLLEGKLKNWQVSELPSYPGSERDWTVTLREDIPIERVFKAVSAVNAPLLEKVVLLDLYKSAQVGKDLKNATFRFFYRDTQKTISVERVEQEHAKIIQTTTEKLDVGRK